MVVVVLEMSPGPHILPTSNDVINETRNCKPDALELPIVILAFEIVSMAGNDTCNSRFGDP